jgi:hypothetical protein
MASFGLTGITVPTPEPYNDENVHKQRENLAYVVLQMIAQAKQEGFTISDSGIEDAIKTLQWNTVMLDLGPIKILLDNTSLAVEQ